MRVFADFGGHNVQGSDFFTVYIRPTSKPFAPKDGEKLSHDHGRLDDEIRFVKFSGISWTHDSEGFFYQVRRVFSAPYFWMKAYKLVIFIALP